ncbi:MAG: Fe-S protein assembly co-chaperone HscB [Pseudomonadota bacterium]
MQPRLAISSDDFTLFGLPQRHALDRAALDGRRRELQAEVHPDRFAAEGAAAQRVAMQWAVRVNAAWQRLRDPLRRAAYLCELRGVPVEAERNTAMPPAFLVQQMQWREELEEAVAAEERRGLDRLTALLDEQGDAAGAAAQVRALMFVARFREDIARRLEALEPPR